MGVRRGRSWGRGRRGGCGGGRGGEVGAVEDGAVEAGEGKGAAEDREGVAEDGAAKLVWRRMVQRGTDSGEVGATEAGEGKGAAEDGKGAASGKMSWAAEDNDARNDVSQNSDGGGK
ncbi:sodium/potassium/calcium exchanger 1-like [Panicum virgatum]|uniref:sodium/potassium/calcium exchanger 1-like n=1 Tax=Panicum virgatum TaxID=38727 RepID=UPI0019D54CEF|nr:sodium/potassium/calcium exchanger 1-like [Panicum virgatum]